MALFDNPFDAKIRLKRSGCSSGRHASEAEHRAEVSGEAQFARVVESGAMRALFPQDATRRAFIKAVGASTAAAAVAQFLPLGAVTGALAQGAPWKRRT